MTMNVWNKLSTDCVHASSVDMFKYRTEKYLARAGYTYKSSLPSEMLLGWQYC